MIWATVSFQSCICWLYRASLSSAAKNTINIINLILVLTIWSYLLFHWESVFAMTSVFSWQNSISLCPASCCTPKPNLPVTPGVSWLPTFAFQSYNEKDIFFGCFGVLVLESLVGLHRTIQLQLLQHYLSGHKFGFLWYWMVCLENKQRSFCCFWDCTKYCISDSFADYYGYSISSKGFFPTVVDITVMWVKLTISVHFSSLIPRMAMFTLAISCFTSASLPWYMDLTLSQVPMQYCSYSITLDFYHHSHPQLGFVFALAPSLHSFWSYFSTDLQLHIGYLPSWGVHLSVSCLFAFSYFMEFAKQEYWSALPFPSPVDYILSELSTMTCPSWVAYAAWVIVSLS